MFHRATPLAHLLSCIALLALVAAAPLGCSDGDGGGVADLCEGVSCDPGLSCDPGTGVCLSPGGCLSDAQCITDAAPRCEPASASCVQCLDDNDCDPTSQRCNVQTNVCVAQSACVSDAECTDAALPRCDLESGECVACVGADDCQVGCEVCVEGACMGAENRCCSNDDCGGDTPFCDPEDNTCVGCVSDADCDQTCERCLGDGTCETAPGSCCDASDCGADTPICNIDAQCVACTSDNDCDTACESCDVGTGACVIEPGSCCEDADCPVDTPACDTASNTCLQCLVDADCDEGCETCDAGAGGVCRRIAGTCCASSDCTDPAAPVCDPLTSQCTGCVDDSDCRPGCEVCDDASGRCALAAEGACCDERDCVGIQGATSCDLENFLCVGCASDEDCGSQSCVAGVCVACELDSDCVGDAVCTEGRCGPAVGCTANSDCGLPLFCNAVAGSCVACQQDSDCRGSQTCDVETGSCVEPEGCIEPFDCLENRLCNFSTGLCEDAECTEDVFDPNDGTAAATRLEPGSYSLSLCANDLDVFAVNASIGDLFSARVTFEQPNVDPALFNAYLVRPDGSLAFGDNDTSGARIERQALPADEVHAGPDGHVIVVVDSLGAQIGYELAVDIIPGGGCLNRGAEPDNNAEEAQEIDGSVDGRMVEVDGVICDGDEDWTKITVPAGRGLLVELESESVGAGNLDLEVLEEQGDGSFARVDFSATEEIIERVRVAEADRERTFAARVLPVGELSAFGAAYVIRFVADLPPPSNDTCDGPAGLAFSGEPESATVMGDTTRATNQQSGVCGGVAGGEVVYTFTLADPASVDIAFAPTTAGDHVLYLHRDACDGEGATPFDCRPMNMLDGTWSIPRLPAGAWFLFVDSGPQAAGPFDLTVTLGEPPAATGDSCIDPVLLQPDGAGIAIVQGDTSALVHDHNGGCVGGTGPDQVWRLDVAQVSFAEITLTDVDFDSGIYVRKNVCESEAQLDRLWCQDDPEPQSRRLLLEPGPHWIFVDGFGTQSGEYTLEVDLDPLLPPTNEDCDTSALLTLPPQGQEPLRVEGHLFGAADDLTASCDTPGAGGPEVLYRFTTTGNGSIELELDTQGAFPPTLELRADPCNAGAAVECLTGDGTEVLSRRIDVQAGTWYLAVGSADGSPGVFELSVGQNAAIPAGDTCDIAMPLILDGEGHAEISGDTSTATNFYSACSGGSSPDLVYRLTLTEERDVRVRLDDGGTFDSAVYIRSDCDGGGGSACGSDLDCTGGLGECWENICSACIDDPEPQVLDAQLPAGEYFIIIDGFRGQSGSFDLTVDTSEPPTPAQCGGCDAPNVVPVNAGAATFVNYGGSTNCGAREQEPSCGFSGHTAPEHIYELTLTELREVGVTLQSQGWDSVLHMREGNCETGDELACVDPQPQEIRRPLGPGTYYFFVDGWGSGNGEYRLTFEVDDFVDRGPDNCFIPEEIAFTDGEATLTGSTTSGQLDDYDQPGCGGEGAPDVVYSMTLDSTARISASIDTEGQWDATLTLQETPCDGPFSTIECAAMPEADSVSGVVPPGTYFLIVDGLGLGDAGDYTLQVSVDTTVIGGNNDCATAHELVPDPVDGFVSVVGNTAQAGITPLHQSCAGGAAPDQVYQFTLDAPAPVEVVLDDQRNFDSALYIRTDCDGSGEGACTTDADCTGVFGRCRAGICADCVDDPEPQRLFGVYPAGTYYVFVDGFGSNAGPYVLSVNTNADLATNNLCADAIPLDFDGSGLAQISGSTLRANADHAASCGVGNAPDVVYSFEMPGEGTAVISIDADHRSAVHVRSTCDDVGTEIACNADQVNPRDLDLGLLDAGTYFIFVDGWLSIDSGDFELSVQRNVP